EFGVVLLLFIIGLELQPSRLWALRKSVFGLGATQVILTGLLLAIAGYLSGLPPVTALVVGLSLSLSSTAFALQVLAEKKQLSTRYGRAAFSTLLFQDLAVIPLLALVPLLSPVESGAPQGSVWIDVLKVVGVLAAVVIGGHYLLRHAFRFIARSGIHEVFTAMALLTVIGIALLMQSVGLSMALGAFLAGVLLADSEFRHELEANIEPFKGLLLGLFFIAVGMSVNLGLLVSQPLLIVALVVGLMAVKSLVLYGLGRRQGLDHQSAISLAFAISQGGEFAFVIFGVAVGAQVMGQPLADLLILVVTLSMAVTPFLFVVNERFIQTPKKEEEDYDVNVPEENQVIIAGFGRFGQIVARILRAKKIGFTALEVNPEQVDFVRKFGNKTYYGDAARLDLLRAAKVGEAKIFVLAIHDIETSLRTAETVRKHFPHVAIYARAHNRKHAYQLMDRDVRIIQRDTLLSSLDMARVVLEGLGVSHRESVDAVEKFRRHDEERLVATHKVHNDEEKMIYLAKQAAKELEEMFDEDEQEEVQAEGRG
ncbi:MAG: cation:proton antiporter, partial [Gammaproteobacteria bacterium]